MGWAEADWNYLDGKLYMRGIDIGELPLSRLCNIVYAHAVEECGPLADVAEVRKNLDQALEQAAGQKGVKKRGISGAEADRILAQVRAEAVG